MKYVLGSFAIIFVVFLTIAVIGGGAGASLWFLDGPSLMPFILIISAIILMTGEYSTHIKAVNAIVSKSYKISHADKEKAINLYKLLARAVVYVTVLQFVMGIVTMLGELGDLSYAGPMVAVVLVSVFYGVLINLVFIYPAIHILKHRENSEIAPVISEKIVVDKLLELCYKKGISPEEILNAEDIDLSGKPSTDSTNQKPLF